MLSKFSRIQFSRFEKKSRYITSYVRQMLNLHNPECVNYQVARSNPSLKLNNSDPNFQAGSKLIIETTKLDNGVTVVSETPSFPGTVDVQFQLNIGTRDETSKESGAMQALKNTYLKTLLQTNETINYGMIQMSGGNSSMDYDQESAMFKASCLEHDVVDIFNMIADCTLEPKNVVAASIGIEKAKHSHSLESVSDTGVGFRNLLSRTAYGMTGLGNPLLGVTSNIMNLDASRLQRFQMRNITPDKVFVGAAGVVNHQEFVDLVERKLAYIPPMNDKSSHNNEREATVYLGGETRFGSDGNTMDLAQAFEGASWTHKDMVTLQLANALLGEGNSFTSQLTLPQRSRSHSVLGENNFVDSFGGINFNFTESGLFGVRVSGMSSNANEMVDLMTFELKRLANGSFSESELKNAKNTLKLQVLLGLETQGSRLTETLQNLRTYGKVVHHEYLSMIDALTSEQVKDAVNTVLMSNPTFIANGGDTARLENLDTILKKLN